MNRFDELIQSLREKSADLPASETVRASDMAKSEPPDQHAEHCFRLPYSSNPRQLEARWK